MAAHDAPDGKKKILLGDVRDLLAKSEREEGIDVKGLPPDIIVTVVTENSTYTILILDPETGDAIIEGGTRFTTPTAVKINGSTFGGSVIKPDWIGKGMHLELWRGENEKGLVTSEIRTINISNDPERVEAMKEIAKTKNKTNKN